MATKANSADIFAAIQSAAENQAGEKKGSKSPKSADAASKKATPTKKASVSKPNVEEKPSKPEPSRQESEAADVVSQKEEPHTNPTITIPMGKKNAAKAVAKTFYLDAESIDKLNAWMEKYNQSASRIINELIRQVEL